MPQTRKKNEKTKPGKEYVLLILSWEVMNCKYLYF